MENKPFLNLRNVKFSDSGDGGRFAAKLGPVATRLGAKKLGYRLVVLAPGKTGWPYHFHYVNEEMFFILEGSGTLRYGDKTYTVQTGDIICAPPGPSTPHQLTNTSNDTLQLLAVSTMEEPDVVEYPDSGKFGVTVGSAPGGDDDKRVFTIFSKKSSGVDYWEGES